MSHSPAQNHARSRRRLRSRLHPHNALALLGLLAAVSASGWAQHGQSSPPSLPDPKITPGDVLPVTKADVCTPGYSGKVRNVPQSVKDQAYKNYGITHHAKGEFEVDHLISLEIGGSNSIRNLWPESYLIQPWNAHVKDQLENELHRQVCAGKIDLATAQRDIAGDWIASYKRYFHTNIPLTKSGAKRNKGSRNDSSADSSSAPKPGLADKIRNRLSGKSGRVWVNLSSGKYFYSGSRYYGNTKQGKYLTEAQARQQGYTAAQGQK